MIIDVYTIGYFVFLVGMFTFGIYQLGEKDGCDFEPLTWCFYSLFWPFILVGFFLALTFSLVRDMKK